MNNMRSPVIIILLILSFFSGIFVKNMLGEKEVVMTPLSKESAKSVRQQGYKFINPLLECEVEGEGLRGKYIPYERKILDRINTEVVQKNPDTHISFYFRNLNNGPWFGLNENEVFSPASLMKVPLLIAYFKWQEQENDLFMRKLEIKAIPSVVEQNIVPENIIKSGQEYTIEELLKHLIINSDNLAAYNLATEIKSEFLLKVYSELGIPLPKNLGDLAEEYISVKEYASFFRILYNSSYLDRQSSENALSILSKTKFEEGIKKFIPKNIVVAHKFGERKIISPSGTINQLHDCGIVYYEKSPYLLCIMTKGKKELSELEPIIQDISKIVYDEVEDSYNQ